MNLPITIDIETLPLLASLDAPYPREDRSPPSNWKDEAKIAQWYVDDESKWRDARVTECSLNPRLGRILCIGYSLPCSDGPVEGTWMAPFEEDEATVLNSFWLMAQQHGGRIVTFNGANFDARWIVLRTLALGLTPTLPSETIRAWFRRYVVQPHCDVRNLLTNWNDKESGTLAEWCAMAGVEYTNGHTGADIHGLFCDGKFAEIASKCREDVRATRELYQKVARVFVSEAA